MRIQNIPLDHILFLDIETVPEYQSYKEMDDVRKRLWESKIKYQLSDEVTAEDLYPNAGIWAEFGKIISISVGYGIERNSKRQFRVGSLFGDETSLLNRFNAMLTQHFSRPEHLLCAHNGKEFDFPYIARRNIIKGLPLPDKLDLFGKKPWQIPHLDTMELWKFGDYKAYNSLALLTNILGIPTPKDDIDGSMVNKIYYQDNDIDRVVAYCEKDVVALTQVFLKLQNKPLLTDEEIQQVDIP